MPAKVLLLAAAVLVAAPAATPGEARPRHRHFAYSGYYVAPTAPPLTIRKRSYLDAGVVVPQGSESAYVAESTTLGAAYVTKDLFGSRFGSNLPNRLHVLGRPEPVFEFETPRDPFWP